MKKTLFWSSLTLVVITIAAPLFVFAAPVISSLEPEDGSQVSRSAVDFYVEFEDVIVLGAGNITVKKASDNSTIEVIDIEDTEFYTDCDGGDYGCFFFTSSVDFEYGTEYYINMDAGIVTDELADPFPGILDATTWSFSTPSSPTVFLNDDFLIGSGFNSNVFGVAVDANGKIVVGGFFTTYDGNPAPYIARLNQDGTFDETFITGTGFDSYVSGVAIDTDNKVLASGNFTTYDGDPVPNIVRLNIDGTLDGTFVEGGNVGESGDVVLDADGKILLIDTSSIYRLNTDGTNDVTFSTGTGFDGAQPGALALDNEGKILVGGSFTTYDGNPAPRIVRLNQDGSIDGTFNPGDGADSTVFAIAVGEDDKIYIGGLFTTYDGNPAPYIARLNQDGTFDDSFATDQGFGGSIRTIVVSDDGKVVAAGSFPGSIARLNADGTIDTSFSTAEGFDDNVSGFVTDENQNLFVGGQFSTYLGDPSSRFAWLLPPEEEPEQPPAEEEGGGGSGSRRRVFEQQTDSDVVNVTLEQLQTQLIELLKQLLQILLAQQQN